MSVTTLLIPIAAQEAEALLEGGAAGQAATAEMTARAATLRGRIAAVDAVRDELHDRLFASWPGARPVPPTAAVLNALLRKLRPPPPTALPTGYDPFVHLFGRSLPVDGRTPKEVAERLHRILKLDDAAFRVELAQDVRGLDAAAGERIRASLASLQPVDLAPAVSAEVARLQSAVARDPPDLTAALDSLVRLGAWSHPLWRLDGEMLPDLFETLGLTVKPEAAAPLFEELAFTRPEVQAAIESLPSTLARFAGAGSYLSGTAVKVLSGSLRLNGGRLIENAVRNSGDPPLTLRHLRLLMEAAFFCEAEDLGLAEAAGVEWHDRA